MAFPTAGELLDSEHDHLQEKKTVISLPRQSFNLGRREPRKLFSQKAFLAFKNTIKLVPVEWDIRKYTSSTSTQVIGLA